MYLDKNEVDFLDLIGFDNSHYPDNFNLSFIDYKKYSGYCCTIVLAAKGYPENPIKDFYIDLSDLEDNDSIKIFHAGTKISNGAIRVTGGRILSVNTYSEDKKSAVDLAYNSVSKIKAYTDSNLRNQDDSLVFFRSDIGS